ncbi:MAG TPA: glycosyltransferase [Syntrophales bacterium]|jgi:glycosyltransferase involved in cell wall biosynthesis|nr:glycosyltransferase [Syntrophales bacterium]HQA82146.1 glycosyltransferase [Syntrophales bacterium]
MDRQEVAEKISTMGEVDILVGIPSYNSAKTIAHVVKAVEAGLFKYFPHCKSLLVNSDGGSTDGTMEAVRDTTVDLESILIDRKADQFRKFVTPYHGIPGKGSAFRTIFEIARDLNVKACAVVDSDLRSITPEWIELLIKPVLEDHYDYVSPYYMRHKYDGTITNSIVYPLTRALYGKRIRQPIGGDFGFSGRLASFYLTKDVWETDVARFGIDIWMTTTAVANGFRICQAFLGAKIHDAKDPGSDLSAMLHQVVSSVFNLMEEYAGVWRDISKSEPVRTFGFAYSVGLEPIHVNLNNMIEKFRMGIRDLDVLYRAFLPEPLLESLHRLAEAPKNRFLYPDRDWVRTVFYFALACHRRVMSTEHIIKSLTPLYLGKVSSFVIETWDSTADEVEQRLEELCLAFEKAKPEWIELWDERQ